MFWSEQGSNKAKFPSSSDTRSCHLSGGRAVVKRKQRSRSSHREPVNAETTSINHSIMNHSNESGGRIVSLSRTLSRLGQSMRRSTASDQRMFPTNFASLLDNDALWLRSLDNHFESQQPPTKLKVILKVSEFSSNASSLMKINEPRRLVSLQDPSSGSSRGRIYSFNHIFVPGDAMKEFNVNSLGGVLKAVLGGSDGCVFTYGLAKTGKTYTMLGVDNSVDSLGVIPFAIAWLFHLIRSTGERTGTEISVFMSAVEVFDSGEVLRDLLAPVGNSSDVSDHAVYMSDEPLNGSYLRNQREVKIHGPAEAGHYLDAAISSQTVPGRNRVSPNVHVVFSFRLLQRKTNGFSSWLRLVDFSSARRDRSGSAITFSGLTAIIQAVLSGRRDLLPLRDKNMTKIILESLGGSSCHVCMITHVSLARNSFHDLQQVIHVSSQLQEQFAKKNSKVLCNCSPCGLNAPQPNIAQQRRRAIQMGTRLYHRALQRSALYSDPEGIVPERLPSYYGRLQNDAEEIDSAKHSHAAQMMSEGLLPANTSSRSVESLRFYSDTGYRHRASGAAYMASPLTYQQPTVSSSVAYHITAQTSAIPSPLSYQRSTKTSSKPTNLTHKMAGPVTNFSSLHSSKGLGSVEAKHCADEVWVDGPPEFQVNHGPEFYQQVQLGSQSEDAESRSTQKQREFPLAELSSSPRRCVDRKAVCVISYSFTTRKSSNKLLSSTTDSEKTQPSALPKKDIDFSCNDWNYNAGRNCRVNEENTKPSTVLNATKLGRFCSFKESSDVMASVSQSLNIESIKVPSTLVSRSVPISPDHSTCSDMERVSVHVSGKTAKEIVHSRLEKALISDGESVYEVMLEEALEDVNLCLNLNAEQLSEEDDNFKHSPAVEESKIAAGLSREDVTSMAMQWPSRKTEQAFDCTVGSIASNTQNRQGWGPSRKSFPHLGSQAIRTEFSFSKPRVGPSVVANNGMSRETGIQSPYSAISQARPPASASSGLGSEVSSIVSSDIQIPASWRSEVGDSSGYDETLVQDSDSQQLTTTKQLSGRKRSSYRDILIQNKYSQIDAMRSTVRCTSNTGFILSSSAQRKSSGSHLNCISPENLFHRTPAALKGSATCALFSAAQTQQSIEPNVPQQKALQILGVCSYVGAVALQSAPTSVLRVATTRNKTLSYTAMIDHSYTYAVDDEQSFQVKDSKQRKRRNSSKSRMPKINCFNQ